MKAEESPFPAYWWGTSLEGVGLESVRPAVGTYGRYEFATLPPIPFEMRGEWHWLTTAPAHPRNIGIEKASRNAQALEALRASANDLALSLPPAFTTFMATPVLHAKIRSNTDCFLDLCPALVRSPLGGGYLIRFLADSQACVFWYLHLKEDGSDHAVVASPDFYGIESEHWDDHESDPADIVFSAESFETFLCRFWLENEIWFARYENTAIPDVGKAYIEYYRANQT